MKDFVDTVNKKKLGELFNTPARPVVTVDVEKYKELLDDPNLSEAEKESFLQALWSIVVAFVDLGFGVHPLQEVCAQELKEAFDKADGTDSNGKQKRDGSRAGGLDVK